MLDYCWADAADGGPALIQHMVSAHSRQSAWK